MSYTKLTDFAIKDSLLTGDPNKIVRGTEIDAEFESLQTQDALNLKTADAAAIYAPLNSPALTGTPTAPTATVGDNSTKIATTEFVTTASFNTNLPGQATHAGGVVTTDGATASWADLATQAEMEAGVVTATKAMSPLRVKQAIDAKLSWSADVTHTDYKISRAMLIDCGYTAVAKGNISNATVTFDYTQGSVQTFTATGSTVTWAFSNWPPTGNLGEILVIGTNLGAFTQSISGVTWLKPDGTTTTSLATYLAANTGRTAFQTSGVDQLLFWSSDAGTTIYGKLV